MKKKLFIIFSMALSLANLAIAMKDPVLVLSEMNYSYPVRMLFAKSIMNTKQKLSDGLVLKAHYMNTFPPCPCLYHALQQSIDKSLCEQVSTLTLETLSLKKCENIDCEGFDFDCSDDQMEYVFIEPETFLALSIFPNLKSLTWKPNYLDLVYPERALAFFTSLSAVLQQHPSIQEFYLDLSELNHLEFFTMIKSDRECSFEKIDKEVKQVKPHAILIVTEFLGEKVSYPFDQFYQGISNHLSETEVNDYLYYRFRLENIIHK